MIQSLERACWKLKISCIYYKYKLKISYKNRENPLSFRCKNSFFYSVMCGGHFLTKNRIIFLSKGLIRRRCQCDARLPSMIKNWWAINNSKNDGTLHVFFTGNCASALSNFYINSLETWGLTNQIQSRSRSKLLKNLRNRAD